MDMKWNFNNCKIQCQRNRYQIHNVSIPCFKFFWLDGLTNESKLCSIADEKIYFFYGQSKLGIEVTESIE